MLHAQKKREEISLQISVGANNKLKIYTLIKLIILIAAAFLQIYIVKSYFKDRDNKGTYHNPQVI